MPSTELRTATEVANLIVEVLRTARQYHRSPQVADAAILSGMNEPRFTLKFHDTREEYTVSVQRSSGG